MPDFPTTLTTDRLLARACDADTDLDGFAPICADPRVAERMWPAPFGGARTREQTRAWLLRTEAHWAAHDFGIWTVRERAGGRLVGQVGLGYAVVDGAAEVEVGFILDADCWGRGYATELTRLALAHAPSLRGLTSVAAFALADDNPRAVATLGRCGFAFERDVPFAGLKVQLYRVAVG